MELTGWKELYGTFGFGMYVWDGWDLEGVWDGFSCHSLYLASFTNLGSDCLSIWLFENQKFMMTLHPSQGFEHDSGVVALVTY